MQRPRILLELCLTTTVLGLLLASSVAGQEEPFETDSVFGELVTLHTDSFVVRAAGAEDVVIHIPTDSAQARREAVEDTTAAAGPHTTYMERDDIVLALEQLAESDESSELVVHYITEGVPARRVVVWLAVGDRPGLAPRNDPG